MNRSKIKQPEGSKLLKPGYLSGKSQKNFAAKKSQLLINGSSTCKLNKMYSRKVATPVKKDRPVLQTLTNNSPIVKVNSMSPTAISQTKVSDDDFNFKAPTSKPTQEFEFKSDPSSLASILNGDGVTRKDLITPRISSIMLSDGRISDMLLLPDGRPSGCRRTLKVSTPTKFSKGPGRVLRSTKQALPKSKQNQQRSTSLYNKSTNSFSNKRNMNSQSSNHKFNSLLGAKSFSLKENVGRKSNYKQTNEKKANSFKQKPEKMLNNQSKMNEFKQSKITRVKFTDENNHYTITDDFYSSEKKPLPAANQKLPRSILKSKKSCSSQGTSQNKKVSRKLKLCPSSPVKKLAEKNTKDGKIEVLTPPVLNELPTKTSPAKNASINRVLNHLQQQMKATKRRSLQQEYKQAISMLSNNLQPIAEEALNLQSFAEEPSKCEKSRAFVKTPVKVKPIHINTENEDKLKAKIEVLQREIKNIQLCQSQRKLQRSLVKPMLKKSENSVLSASNPALAHRLMFNPGSYSPLPKEKIITKDLGESPTLPCKMNKCEESVKTCESIPLNLDTSATSIDGTSISSNIENIEFPAKSELNCERKTWKEELSYFNKTTQQSKDSLPESIDNFIDRLNKDTVFKTSENLFSKQTNKRNLASSFQSYVHTTKSSTENDTIHNFNQPLKKRIECYKPRFAPYNRKSIGEIMVDEEVASFNLNAHKRKVIYKQEVPTNPVAKYLVNQQIQDFTSPRKFLP